MGLHHKLIDPSQLSLPANQQLNSRIGDQRYRARPEDDESTWQYPKNTTDNANNDD
jgi:hypothetical protein